jgi:UDP-N-acetylglucosamine diphosphorylase/glucosamine-1-phosphate N-acetyltransferase
LYDDAVARGFEPLALTRPLGEVRAGLELIRVRWELALGARAAGFISAPHLRDFEEREAPQSASGMLPAKSLVANTRCVIPLAQIPPDASVVTCEGRVAAVRLERDTPVAELADGAVGLEQLAGGGTRATEVHGRWLDAVWELITTLIAQLTDDIVRLGPTLDCALPPGTTVIGGPIYVQRGAAIEPLVCIDASAGPVLVRAGATVRAFTRLVGPCAIGAGTAILADRVSGSSIGEQCVVRGEVSECIVLGHSNKAHDGFVGHSYLGRWVNLGAGTITSNLKNTYGTVQLWTPAGARDTGTIKLGTFFGDHVKTGIGLRLTTGSVVGAGANVYGSAMPPKFVPPFSWGEGSALGDYRLDKFLEIATRAMERRSVTLTEGGRRVLAAAYARAHERSA